MTKRRVVKVNAMSQAKLVKLLLEGTRSCQQLADETGLHYGTVLAYTRALHREGAAFVAEYQEDTIGRDQIKVYKIGVGVDAKRYRIPAAHRSARYRAGRKLREAQAALTLRPAVPPAS